MPVRTSWVEDPTVEVELAIKPAEIAEMVFE
jgi:hypothetical protein